MNSLLLLQEYALQKKKQFGLAFVNIAEFFGKCLMKSIIKKLASLVNFYDSACYGFVLFKSKTRFVQIWFIKSGYEITPHSHSEENIELIFLFGFCRFVRISPKGTYRTKLMRPWHICNSFTVPAGYVHYFTVSKYMPLVFLNYSTFLKGYKPKSAALDFKVV